MKNLKVAFFTLILSTLISPKIYANVIYSQGATSNNFYTSAVANISNDPGFTWTLDQDEENWAYFTAASTTSFNQITWYGSNADSQFAVDFFNASCFSCSANWVSTGGTFSNNLLSNRGPFNQSNIIKTEVSSGLYAYTIDLTNSVTISQGALYAISVVNNYNTTPFQWAGSNSGSGFHLQYIVGQAMFLKAPGSLAFTLSNSTISPVPELNASVLLLSGLILTGIINFRRHRYEY